MADIEVLRREAKELEEINKKQEERIQNLESKALQLMNLYFVFQGVILSAITKKEQKCIKNYNGAWIPFALSLLAALLNTTALCHTIHSFVKCSQELDLNREELRTMNEKIRDEEIRAREARENHNPPDNRRTPDSVTQWIRIVFSVIGIFFFLGFSGVILYGCFQIIC